MENFVWYNPTKIIFGQNTQLQVGEMTRRYGKKVFLHFGGGSIKASGLYGEITKSLTAVGIDYVPFGGVRPNPRLSLVYEGIRLCRKEKCDMVLAVGGGSVIDSAKAIAIGACYDGDVWDFYSTTKKPEKKLPVGVVLTIPAAGSESSDGSVVTKEETKEKLSCCCDLMFPEFAILNPQLCYTLPKNQIKAGGVDILSHIMERYFVPNTQTDVSDRLCEAAMRGLIHNLPRVLENTKDYDAWAEMMWVGNIAHSGLLGKGRRDDWASHNIEHELSAYYDIAHGTGLAVIFPAWMRYVYNEHSERFVAFAKNVWGIDVSSMSTREACMAGIEAMETFFRSFGMATHLRELGIDGENFEVMAQKACRSGQLGNFKILKEKDVIEIYRLAL